MKNGWIVVVSVLGLTSGLWAQTQNQTWPGQSGMGQIPNNGEISGLANNPNLMNNSYNRVMTGPGAEGQAFYGRVPYLAQGNSRMPLSSSALDGFTRYSNPPRYGSGGTSPTYYSGNPVAGYRVPSAPKTVAPSFPQVFPAPRQGQESNPALEMSNMQTLYPPTSPRSTNSAALMPWGTLTTLNPTPAPTSQTVAQNPSTSESPESLDRTPVFQAKPISPDSVKTQRTQLEQSQLGQQPMVPSWRQQTAVQPQHQESVTSSNWGMSQTSTIEDGQNPSPTHETDNTVLPSTASLAAPAPDKPEASTVLSSDEALSMVRDKSLDSGSPALPQASNKDILPLLQEARHDLQAGQAQAALEIYQRVANWRPRAPAVLAGQCLSHLALGHLMSSALYLSRWLEVEPKVLQQPVDLGASIGSNDLLKQRVRDVEGYLAISEMGELLFLRAFINFKTNHLQQARQDITRALVLNPTLQGAKALQAAISQG